MLFLGEGGILQPASRSITVCQACARIALPLRETRKRKTRKSGISNFRAVVHCFGVGTRVGKSAAVTPRDPQLFFLTKVHVHQISLRTRITLQLLCTPASIIYQRVSVTTRPGKVIIRFNGHQCTLDPDEAAKAGLALIDAAKKAAQRGKAFSEK